MDKEETRTGEIICTEMMKMRKGLGKKIYKEKEKKIEQYRWDETKTY